MRKEMIAAPDFRGEEIVEEAFALGDAAEVDPDNGIPVHC